MQKKSRAFPGWLEVLCGLPQGFVLCVDIQDILPSMYYVVRYLYFLNSMFVPFVRLCSVAGYFLFKKLFFQVRIKICTCIYLSILEAHTITFIT